MDMDGWRDILHFDFHGEHVLFESLRLSSGFTFLVASVLTICLCLFERYLTYLLSAKSNLVSTRHSRLGNAIFRTGVYWVVTLLRLLYMLLAMTFHVGLLFVVVTTLSVGQFAIEYTETQDSHLKAKSRLEGAPFLSQEGLASAEYLDHPHAASSYPPRKIPTAKGHATVSESSRTVFTIDDGDEAV